MENQPFLKEQILTYLGNKRSLLNFIAQGVKYAKDELKKDKLSCVDLFSGSGVVARYLKQHANFLVANDLELYSKITNECYLSNPNNELLSKIDDNFITLAEKIELNLKDGFITRLYAPKDESNITKDDRVFYTHRNATYIDTARNLIDELELDMQKFFIAPLLYLASVHSNTSGIFKGFYKNRQGIGQFGGEGQNALKRITKDIKLIKPIFSNFNVPFYVEQKDANALAKELDVVDVCYLDPPYNQHPYGSNYFMLNLIASNIEPTEISRISGIQKGWNKSIYNQRANAQEAFFELISNLKARIIIISFNSEGFISQESFAKNLSKFGKTQKLEQKYNVFRGSRNLKNRNLHVKELLYVLKKPKI
ncbi:DNA adenine methylase [Campylobacter sp. faydin G-24]|uniref:site-specific DNA-methyltransferase (adenine-specific) n=1 Tax=Campylobacter anatolicus TaxID=2829105 RepID=A0ABS5HFY1_9BACT|nr:DNA adenine methylase [Campylobacter anatolicus]